MNRRPYIIAVAAALLVFGLLLISFEKSQEPSYQGKALSKWLDDLNDRSKVNAFVNCREAIGAMGTNALPFVICQLTYVESPWKSKLFGFLRSQQVLKQLIPDSTKLYNPSLFALMTIGTNAFPALEQACSSRHRLVRARAASCLAMVMNGPSGIIGQQNKFQVRNRDF